MEQTPNTNSLQERVAELSVAVGGLAHEIKNPLSTITLNLKLLGEDIDRYNDEDHKRLRRRLKRVQEETDRIQIILDDFLRYAGNVELQKNRVDICESIGEMSDFFAPQAEAARVVFRTQLPQQHLYCELDANFFKQALLNLMINAIQEMPSGGELLIKVSQQSSDILIEVIDTGPGIPREKLDLIFKAYYSTKKGGSGLGLPTARRIIKELGGNIKVESETGKGTRFLIYLPVGS